MATGSSFGAGAGAADPDGFERRDIYVECKGPDAELLTERDGELLRALEHIAAKTLALESEEHDRVSFDANGFKAERARALRDKAEDGLVATIVAGRAGTPMPPWKPFMTEDEARWLVARLKEGDTDGN